MASGSIYILIGRSFEIERPPEGRQLFVVREIFGSSERQEGPTRAAVVDWAREVYDDLDFRRFAAGWRRIRAGRPAGYLPVYVPREILHAYGFLPVGIHGGGDRLEIIRGRRLLPVLYLSPAPLGHRAGPVRPARHALRGPLPLHLRRHPQPVRDVEAALPGHLRALPRRAAESRSRRPVPTSGRENSGGCSTTWAGLRASRHRPGPARVHSRSTTRCAT